MLDFERSFSGKNNTVYWCPCAKKGDANKYEKHFQKMYRDVGMAVPKTTETRCRDGSVQARHVIQRLHLEASAIAMTTSRLVSTMARRGGLSALESSIALRAASATSVGVHWPALYAFQ